MSIKNVTLLASLGAIVLFSLIIFISSISINNQEIELRNQAEAQRGKIEVVYDNMWKIIHQTNDVKNSYSSDFKDVVKAMMDGRYSKGDGSLMKLVVEQNPNLSPSMYTKVMDAIQIERTNFTKQQIVILDIIRQHKSFCNSTPNKWFIKNKTPIEYTPISSTRTKEVMETGVDDNVEL